MTKPNKPYDIMQGIMQAILQAIMWAIVQAIIQANMQDIMKAIILTSKERAAHILACEIFFVEIGSRTV